MLPGLDGAGRHLAEIAGFLAFRHEVTVIRIPPDLYRHQDLTKKLVTE